MRLMENEIGLWDRPSASSDLHDARLVFARGNLAGDFSVFRTQSVQWVTTRSSEAPFDFMRRARHFRSLTGLLLLFLEFLGSG
jgi:hypothetical protein